MTPSMLNHLASIQGTEAFTLSRGVSNCGYTPYWEFRIHVGHPLNQVGYARWMPDESVTDFLLAHFAKESGLSTPPSSSHKVAPMLNSLLEKPGFISLSIFRTDDDKWYASVEMKGRDDYQMIMADTPQEVLEELALIVGLPKDRLDHTFPATRNTSAGELRRMHEEADEDNT